MDIISLSFFIFVAISVLTYYIFPKKFRVVILLISSLVFYGFSGLQNLVYILATIISTYFISKKLVALNTVQKGLVKADMGEDEYKSAKNKLQKKKRSLLVFGLALNFGLLMFVKTIGFLAIEQGVVFSTNFLGWVSPLGISFYTFIVTGFLIDCYWGKCKTENNIIKHALFVSYFPQIVQGPINSYKTMSSQLDEGHSFDGERLTAGIVRTLWGLFKKLVIAERLTIFVDAVFNDTATVPGIVILVSVVFYLIQLYADFSGGIDIVMGVSAMFGIQMDENFKQPFFSKSLSEFWTRWHITLGTWMKTYVFNPLAFSKPFGKLGKKLKKVFGVYIARTMPTGIALFLTFILVGIWHGVNTKYLLFGVTNGVIILFSTLMEQRYTQVKNKLRINNSSKIWATLRVLRTLCVLVFLFYILRSNTVAQFAQCFARTICDANIVQLPKYIFDLGLDCYDFLLVGLSVTTLFAVDFYDYLHPNCTVCEKVVTMKPIWRDVVIFVTLFVILIFGCYGPAFKSSGFLYQMF